MKIKTIKVSISKTMQAVQFEPVTVTVEHTAELGVDDDVKAVRENLYKRTSASAESFIKQEVLKYRRLHKAKVSANR